MKKLLSFVLVFLACHGVRKTVPNPHMFIDVKDYGKIEIELYPREAPLNVANVIKLVKDHFYDGLTFHRVIKGFVIQTGCQRGDGTGWPGYYIEDEISLSLTLQKGTVAMANKGPGSNGSQFFIAMRPCPELEGRYTIIGQVIKGWDVAEKISEVKTGMRDAPIEKVIVNRIWVE